MPSTSWNTLSTWSGNHMGAKRAPVTAAVRVLREAGVEYTEHVFDYERFPGAHGAAEFLGVDPHVTAKTIVFTTADGGGAVVLMYGDREVSTKKLARVLGVKSTRPATQREADSLTGYRFGGTSPLGMRSDPPVFAQTGLVDLDLVYVNAGSRGFLIGIDPHALIELTGARLADLATD
jgi:Cys-tRNA(Pro) deacylase